MKERLQRFTQRGIELRERFSRGMIIRSLIIFILSLIFYMSTSNYYLEAIFGLGMIISGAIVGLFILIFLIFFFLERMLKNKKEEKKTTKKVVKKTVKKKATTKKVVKKKKTTSKKKK